MTDPASPPRVSAEDPAAAKTDEQKEDPGLDVTALTVSLLDSGVLVNIGGGVTRMVSYEDFMERLKANIPALANTNREVAQSFILPQNVYFMATSRSTLRMVSYYPACIRDVNYRGTIRKSVIPNIVIAILMTKDGEDGWRVDDARYYCTNLTLRELERGWPGLNTPGISLLPFTNIYDDARLCYGENVRVANVKAPDFKSLIWYYEILFTSPFNNDLGLRALRSSSLRDDPARWYSHLAKCAEENLPFPYEKLSAF